MSISLSVISTTSPNARPLTNKTTSSSKTPTNTSRIDSFKICKNMDELKQLHCHLTKKGHNHKLSNITQLITSCVEMGKPQSINYARKAFELFKKDESLSGTGFMYNSLIRGYAFIGLGDEAILLYVQMVSEGVTPDNYTFPFVLSACAKSGGLNEGVQVHGVVWKMGLEGDMFIRNSLIHFYCEFDKISYGRKVFDGMTERNVVSWTSMICGLSRRDLSKEAIDLFFEMVEAGAKPNSVTMVFAISACTKLRDLDTGERLCDYMRESGLKLNDVMVNALVDMYMKCGAVEKAKHLFDESGDKNLVLFNTILSNYSLQGLAVEAFSVFDAMLRWGLLPDRVSMLSLISASGHLGDIVMGRRCHGYVLRHGLEGSDSISNAIIDMYTKCSEQDKACKVFDLMPNKTAVSWNSLIAGCIRNDDLESAWKLFNEMPERNIVSWNTMIGALVKESLFQEVIEVFRAMQKEDIKADKVTMVGVASACGYLGALDLAKWIQTYIEKNEIFCDMKLETALVDMFARCGDPQSAMHVFGKMKEKDITAWTAAIGAMAMVGNGEQAIQLLDEMLMQGLKPDNVVFVGVLTACSHGGLVEQGTFLFNSMHDIHGISPQIVHYGCMVDLLGRAGLLERALDLIKSMPMEPNDIVWGSLLAACRSQKNVEIASYAAERITEKAHNRTGTQVLLSNIYASAGKWTDVARVRLRLKEKGVKKLPGSSLIEVDGEVHEFVSSDESHPDMTRIALMLDEINSRLAPTGHVPGLSNILLDVDEQEKEYLLSRHSE